MRLILIILCFLIFSVKSSWAASYLDSFCAQKINLSQYKEKDVEKLIRDLKSNDVNVRAMTADTLSCLGELAIPAVPSMIELFKEPNGEASINMIAAVARIGKFAVPELTVALNNKDKEIRMGACDALDKIGPPANAAISQLIKLLSEPGNDVSHHAAYALGSIGKSAMPMLLDIIKNGPDNSRVLIVQNSFRRVNRDDYPRDVLMSIIASQSESSEARRAAMKVLGYLGSSSEAMIPHLITLLGDSDGGLGLAAARALSEIGRPSVPAIMHALLSPDAKVRSSATYAVQYMYFPMEDAVPTLILLLDDKEPTVKYGALYALQRIGTKGALASIDKFKQKQQKP